MLTAMKPHHPGAVCARPRDATPDAPMIFVRLAEEVGRCAATAADVQDLFATVPHRKMTGGEMQRAQSLDLLEQTLRDLAVVLVALGSGQDPGDPATLTAACRLNDVARRLQGAPVTPHDDDLEMF